VLAWTASLLADRRVRLDSTGLEPPLLLILAATLFSDIVNPEWVSSVAGDVLKALTFFLSFFLVFYMIVSVIRTRAEIEFLVKALVSGGAILAVAAIVERRTHYNVFDHLSSVAPVLHYNGVPGDRQLVRGGQLRAFGPAQHPIALSVLFVLLLPFAFYLARRYGNWRWKLVALLLTLGVVATVSRTGILSLVVIISVFLIVQPRAVLRLWPALIPAVVAIQIAVPGALGTIRKEFFPKGGLIADQADVQGRVSSSSGRLAKLGPALEEWSRTPLLGRGFGTRITVGQTANATILDDQWLGALLETGFVGVAGWLWLFVRSVRRLTRAAKQEPGEDSWLMAALAASTTAFGVSMLVYDAFSFIQNVFVLFILLALGATLLRLRTPGFEPALRLPLRSAMDAV
jgi:O-antigen ligase